MRYLFLGGHLHRKKLYTKGESSYTVHFLTPTLCEKQCECNSSSNRYPISKTYDTNSYELIPIRVNTHNKHDHLPTGVDTDVMLVYKWTKNSIPKFYGQFEKYLTHMDNRKRLQKIKRAVREYIKTGQLRGSYQNKKI